MLFFVALKFTLTSTFVFIVIDIHLLPKTNKLNLELKNVKVDMKFAFQKQNNPSLAA